MVWNNTPDLGLENYKSESKESKNWYKLEKGLENLIEENKLKDIDNYIDQFIKKIAPYGRINALFNIIEDVKNPKVKEILEKYRRENF